MAGAVACVGIGVVGGNSVASFAAAATSVTPGTVTVAPPTAGSNASYTIPFTVASALGTGGQINLTAPAGTYFTACTSAAECAGLYSIAVSGGGSAAVDSVAYPANSGAAENAIVITLGTTSVAPGEKVTVSTQSSTTNPTKASSSYTIAESTSADTAPANSPAYSIVASSPSAIDIVSGNGQTAQVGTAFKQPLTVVVDDAYGNPVSSAAVTFAPVAGDASASGNADGTFVSCPANTGSTPAGDCTVVTNSAGQATSSTLTANNAPGGFTVTATVNTATGTAEATFSETNASAPTPTVTPGTVKATPNTAGASSTYTVTLTTNDALPVGDTITLLAPDGTTFPAPSCTVVAITPCTNPTVTYTGGPSNDAYNASVTAATGPDSGGQASTTNNEITITLGNTLAGSSTIPANTLVTVTITGVTNPQKADPAYTIDESDQVDPAFVPATSYAIVPGPATTLAVVSSTNNQSAQVTQQFSRLAVTATDQYGNTELAGSPVTFSLPTSAPSGTFPGGTTTQNDQTDGTGTAYSSVITADTKAGSWTAVAEIPNPGGSPVSPVNFSLKNVPGSPATITQVTGGADQSTTVGTAYANPLVVTVTDQYSNPVPNSNVTFASPSLTDAGFGTDTCSGGTTAAVLTCTTATNSSGQATVSDVVAGTKAGTYNITASDGSPSTQFPETNTAGAPAQIVVVSGDSQDGVVNSAFPQPLVVQVQDQYANPVSGVPVEFTAPQSAPSGTFASCAHPTPSYQCEQDSDASGDATSSTLTADGTAGSFAVVASDPNSQSVTTATFNLVTLSGAPAKVTPGPATAHTSAVVGTQFGTFQVTVTDAGNSPVSGANITFSVPSGLGTFANGSNTVTVVTDSSGHATSTTYTASNQAYANYAMTVTPTGSTSPSATFTLSNLAGAPASLIVTPNSSSTPQSAVVGQTFAHNLSAQVLDKYGNGVGGVVVTFTAPASGASGTFAAGCTGAQSPGATCAITTSPNGTAVATAFTAGHTAGAYNVSAAATGLTAVSYQLTNTNGPAAGLTVTSGAGQSAQVGTAFAKKVTVTVTDQYGNPVNGAQVMFTVPNTAGQPGATFPSATTAYATTSGGGVATSPTFTANHVAGPWSLKAQVVTCTTGAASCNVGAPVSASETNTADTTDPVTIHTVSATTGQARQAGQVFALPLEAQVLDQFGNPAPGVLVTFTLPTTAPDATFPNAASTASAASASNGIAVSPAVTAGLTTGRWTATASATVAATKVTSSFGESNTEGYWLAGSDGSVQQFGDAPFHGSAAGAGSRSPFVGMAALPNGSGYYLVNQRGGVFAYGAPFYGSAGTQAISGSVVGIAVAPAGNGYWLVTSTGAVYPFGPGAHSYGDLRNTALGSPIVGMAVAPGGTGYWLAAAGGGVFAYGSAHVHGNAVGQASSPVVGIAANPFGDGYWLAASNGGVFTYNTTFYGSEGNKGVSDIVGIIATPSGQGYWVIGHDGSVYNFGPQGLNEGNGTKAGEPVVGAAEG